MVHRTLPGVRTVKVGPRPHDNDTGEIDESADRGAQKRFERRVVLLLRRAIYSGPIREQLRRVLESLTEQISAEIYVRS